MTIAFITDPWGTRIELTEGRNRYRSGTGPLGSGYTADFRDPARTSRISAMWIVRLALGRPYTFVVMAILIAILGGTAIVTHAGGYLPLHRHPHRQRAVGLPGPVARGDGEARRHRTSNAVSLPTSTILNTSNRRPTTATRWSESTSIPTSRSTWRSRRSPPPCKRSLRQMPPGMFPANVLKYDAASVPILQLGPLQQDPARAGNLRPRQQLHPHPARHRAGRLGFLSVRRQSSAP